MQRTCVCVCVCVWAKKEQMQERARGIFSSTSMFEFQQLEYLYGNCTWVKRPPVKNNTTHSLEYFRIFIVERQFRSNGLDTCLRDFKDLKVFSQVLLVE